MAETSAHRIEMQNLLSRHIPNTDGLSVLDIGSGGDPYSDTCDTFDLPMPYNGSDPSNLTYKGDASEITKIVEKKYDIVYSSHLLEDFRNTPGVLREWRELLNPGGIILLLLPHQRRYLYSCKKKGEQPNAMHIHDFSPRFLSEVLDGMGWINHVVVPFYPPSYDSLEYNFGALITFNGDVQ